MTIWLLTLLLLAALGALGHRQGAIRVAASFLGIVAGALLASPLGHLFRHGLAAAGLKHPLWLELLPPCLGFIFVLTIFKTAGFIIHKKVDVFYKYKAGDLRMALWERLNQRLGLCLGLFNGAAYLVLLCVAVYTLSYWTYQMATPESDPKGVQILNRLGKDLESTGMDKVAVSVDRMSSAYYDAADIVGLIYHNPLLQARVARYPSLLGLAERPEFQDLANDSQFTELEMRQAPIMELINHPKVQAILKNPETLQAVHDALVPDLQDLRTFLETGKSPKYDAEQILGRWDFDVSGALALLKKEKPNLSSTDMSRIRKSYTLGFVKTSFVATTDHQAIVKNFPHARITPGTPPSTSIEMQTLSGQWQNSGGKYDLTLTIEGKQTTATATIEGQRLMITSPELKLAFAREE